jgi:acetyl esterase/lipase
MLGAVLAGMARGQALQPQVSDKLVTEERYPVQRGAFPRGVRGIPDLVFARAAAARPLTLDLYLPRGPASLPRPLVVYIHGGLWQDGSKRTNGAFADWPLALASLAARGFVVASIDYRLSQEAPFPAAILDVKDALRWLRSKAGVYGIDRARVLVWGADAGGHLAALAATSCGAAGLERPQAGVRPKSGVGGQPPAPVDESACVQAAVVWGGVADFAQLASMREANAFLGCQRHQDCGPQRRLASPVTYIGPGVPPFLIIHGIEDGTVPVGQARALNDRLREAGGSVELILLPGVGYGFVGGSPEGTREASERAWSRTVNFMERMLRPGAR